MKNIKTVFLKELKRFFTDPRMLLALFLPGILIFVVYSFMGNIMGQAIADTSVTYSTYEIAYTDNSGVAIPSIISFFDSYLQNSESEKTNHRSYHVFESAKVADAKQDIKDAKYDVLIVFSDNFETNVFGVHDPNVINHIDLYYNGASKKATQAYSILGQGVSLTYNNYYMNVDENYQVIDANASESNFVAGQSMGFIFPMVTVSLLFSTVMSTCPDAVAGEKERGTLAAMLLTPIKRSELALGKILALCVVSAASGLVSFAGLAGSIPKLMGGLEFTFTPVTIVLLAFLVISTLLLFVTFGLTVSSVAKTTKEAMSYLGPCTMIFMLIAIVPSIVDTKPIGFAFVPLVNMASCMSQLVGGGVTTVYFLITILVNLGVAGLFVFLTTRIFNNERLMVK